MKRKLFYTLVIIQLMLLPNINYARVHETDSSSRITLNIPNALEIKDVSEKTDAQSFYEKNMPWVIAFIIGLLSALVNFWVAHRLRQSNERNLQRQIDNSKETSITQFKTTISTKNRQDWINDLRHTLSELIGFAAAIAIEFEINGNQVDKSNVKELAEKIFYCHAKIGMLLNRDKREQEELMLKVNALVDISTKKHEKFNGAEIESKMEEVVKSAGILFKIHWDKIKSMN